MRLGALLVALVVGCLLGGCPAEPTPPAPASTAPTDTTPTRVTATHTDREVDARCGCALPEVGRCSEWANLDGRWVRLVDHGLGSMPFCKKEGVRVRVSGTQEGQADASTSEVRVTKIEVLR